MTSTTLLIFILLVSLPKFESKNLKLWEISEKINESFNLLQNHDLSKILMDLKPFEFIRTFPRSFGAGMPHKDLPNITTECLEDLAIIGGAMLNSNKSASPELSNVLSQSKIPFI